jgi:nucleoside-triphosphatase THEP1
MIIIITGAIGVGKTTVLAKLLKICRQHGYTCGGILTSKKEDSLIIEDIQTGKKEMLASTHNIYSGPRTPKYYFNNAGIEFGIKAIEEGVTSDILFIDEIGRLELNVQGFHSATKKIKQWQIKNCILVIRQELLADFLPQLPPEPFIFETTAENRDQLPEEIVAIIAKYLPKID